MLLDMLIRMFASLALLLHQRLKANMFFFGSQGDEDGKDVFLHEVYLFGYVAANIDDIFG